MNNPDGDLLEVYFDVIEWQFKPHPDGICFNTWKKNTYGTAIGADCFGPPAYFDDDDDGCAPGYDDDDSDSDSDSDSG